MAKLYKNWTIQEKIAAMLLATGYEEVESKTDKYRVFMQSVERYWIFLGKMGSVRINRTKPTVTGSIDVADRYRVKLKGYEKANDLN